MITDPILGWIFTVVFACVALYLLYRVATGLKHPVQAVGHGLHFLMAVVMVAMAWPWWHELPWLPQLLLFIGATLWFLAMVLLRARGVVSSHEIVGHRTWHQVVHALMMSSMVWMVAVMAPGETDHAHAHHHHEAGMSCFAFAVGVAVTVLMFVAAIVEGIDAGVQLRERKRRRESHVVESGVMAIMLAGMAGMCWLMFV